MNYHTPVAVALILSLLAGLSTGIGSMLSLFLGGLRRSHLQFSLGLSTGVMVYVSLVELLPQAIETIGFLWGNTAFFGGIFFIMAIDFLIPHEYIEERMDENVKDAKMMKTGILMTLGIAIHNFPEGLAVFMSSVGDLRLGIPLAVAIAIHNIPEGIAIAAPVYHATHSRRKAFWYSFLSGMAEPVAAGLAALLLLPYLTPALLACCLAFVAGIMVFISFDELLPLSFAQNGYHISIIGILAGMFVMALSLLLVTR